MTRCSLIFCTGSFVAVLFLFNAHGGECSLSESTRKVEGVDCSVLTLSNGLVQLEVLPKSEGEASRFKAKGKSSAGLEYLVDCFYNSPGRWLGAAYDHRVENRGPDKVSVTVTCTGKIPDAALAAAGTAVDAPEIKIERTMSLVPDSTRLQVDVKITNTGKTVAPAFRYVPLLTFAGTPPMKNVGFACWFLPEAGNVEFFDSSRGDAEMGDTNYGEGAPPEHRFNRFTPGQNADYPRYESAGWAAVLTSAGATYCNYESSAFDFMQYSYIHGHAWEFTLEPHSKAADLKPGATLSYSFTLAIDPKDVTFGSPTVSYERPSIPESVAPGEVIKLKFHATTVAGKEEQAKATFEITDSAGKSVAQRAIEANVKPIQFVDLSGVCKVPDNSPSGAYAWTLKTGDGKAVGSGKIEVRTAPEAEAAKRSAASSIRVSPQRLEQLKKGFECQYVYYRGSQEAGGSIISLKYDAHEKIFTLQENTTLVNHHTVSTVTFSADETPELKSFAINDPDQKHLIEGRVNGDKLTGYDQDGDPYEIPYHSEFLPNAALNFVLLATDWSTTNSMRVRLFDERVQDLLPTLNLTADRGTRSIKTGSETASCTSVVSDRSRTWMDQSGRIVEVAFKDNPFRMRLGNAPKFDPPQENADEGENDETQGAALADLVKRPPVTGVAISQVIAKSQAAHVGLAVGDIILKYGGADVPTRGKLEEIKRNVSDAKSSRIVMEVLRGKEQLSFTLTPGMIGIQTLDVEKDKPVDMVTAQYGSMGFGPGPRGAPSALEILAREKCGSQIPWIRSFAEARKRSQEQNKVLLWWASPVHGSATYKIECWNDYLIAGLFTDPWLVSYINRNFVLYNGPLTEKQMQSYKLGFMTAPAFVFLTPDGELIHEVDGLSTMSVEYFTKVFHRVLKAAQHLPQPAAPKETSAAATLNYIEALLADFDPEHAASEAKKAASSMVGDDRTQAHYLEGRALQMLHKEAEAVDALQLAWAEAQNISSKTSILAERGLTLLRAGHPDRALQALRQPLGENPAGPRAVEGRYLEGVALHLLNRDEEARQIWKAAAESNEKDPWAWRCASEYEGIGPFNRGFETVYWIPDEAVRGVGASPMKIDADPTIPHTTEFPAHDSAEAVRCGVRYLLENQAADGGWNDTNYDFGGLRAMPNVRVAVTAICCEALLAHRDTNPRAIDAAIEKAWPYMIDKSRMTWDDKNEIIWAHMYRMNFFAAWLKVAPPKLHAEIIHQMQLIADAFAKSQGDSGFWRHEYDNDFVTGSVLISMKLAKDNGVVVNDDAIDKGIRTLEKMRSPRGTYPYGDNPSGGPVAWKGCTGRAVNAELAMLLWGRNSADRLREAIDKYVQWNFVQERVRKETFHSDQYMIGGFFFWYNMHVLSQAVRSTDVDTAKRAAKLMRDVVLKTREIDGTWVDSYDLGKSYATGMALLVLATANATDK